MTPAHAGPAADYRSCHCSMMVDLPALESFGGCECVRRTIVATVRSEGAASRFAGRGLVVVPTSRKPTLVNTPGLGVASELSQVLGWDLVVVSSLQSSARDVYWSGLVHRSARLIDLDGVEDEWFPRLPSHAHDLSHGYWADTGKKRNLGLALAKQEELDYVLFVDDDIRPDDPADDGTPRPTMDAAGVRAAVELLDRNQQHRVVGWVSRYQADNSMLGHSRRAAGLSQGIFLGGNALLACAQGDVPSFPTIYNEDWFFCMAVRARAEVPEQALVRAGSVWQSPYRVYRAPRAVSEEPGDQIAENLMNLVEDHEKAAFTLAERREFWAQAQVSRQHLIAHLYRELRTVPTARFGALVGDTGQHPRKVLAAALARNRELSPRSLAGFVHAWRSDHEAWKRHLREDVPHLAPPQRFSPSTSSESQPA